jgi:hypothetical protein
MADCDGPSKYARKPRRRFGVNLRQDVNKYHLKQAQRLKSAYIVERQTYETRRDNVESSYRPSPKYDGGYRRADMDHPEGQVLDNIWLAVVRALTVKKIDPVEYVHKLFSALAGTKTAPPAPDRLTSERWMQVYREGEEINRVEVKLSLVLQQKLARQLVAEKVYSYGLSVNDAIRAVLLDEEAALSWLFRYCLAVNTQDPKVRRLAKLFWVGAALQFIQAKEQYKLYWDKWIPPRFDKVAEHIYDLLIR